MKNKITSKNIFNYIQGNARLIASEFGFESEHMKEQVAYRMLICKKSCSVNGACEHCGCDLPGRFFTTDSCNNGEKFPDLMNAEDWNKFKIENGIE